MRNQMICAFRKDVMEYLRSRKNLLFAGTLLGLCAMVLGATCFLPSLLDELMKQAARMISDTESITTTLASFFPETLAANMGVLSSDIAIFYGVVVILSTYNLVSKEIADGKWIFPIGTGYKPFVLILSKGIVYGMGAAFPCVVFYNLYYFAGGMYLTVDYGMDVALMNSLVLGFTVFAMVYLTIILASIYKRAIMAASTMILFVAVAPDIFALFAFGKYLPTHLLTYLYRSGNEVVSLLIPGALTVAIAALLTVLAAKKAAAIEAAR